MTCRFPITFYHDVVSTLASRVYTGIPDLYLCLHSHCLSACCTDLNVSGIIAYSQYRPFFTSAVRYPAFKTQTRIVKCKCWNWQAHYIWCCGEIFETNSTKTATSNLILMWILRILNHKTSNRSLWGVSSLTALPPRAIVTLLCLLAASSCQAVTVYSLLGLPY